MKKKIIELLNGEKKIIFLTYLLRGGVAKVNISLIIRFGGEVLIPSIHNATETGIK
jgi:hypothetical protein